MGGNPGEVLSESLPQSVPWRGARLLAGWDPRLCVPPLPAGQSLLTKTKLTLWHPARSLCFPSAAARDVPLLQSCSYPHGWPGTGVLGTIMVRHG